jgi:predicted ATPase
LVEARGLLVSKEDLLKTVWPTTYVHENNIEVQISAIRKILGSDQDTIQTMPGRGYRLNAAVHDITSEVGHLTLQIAPEAEPRSVLNNVPAPMSDFIGRHNEVDEVIDLLSQHRTVTLTGAGGVGKTRLGVEVAHRLVDRFPDGVCLVELAPLSDPDLLPETVAAAFGLREQHDWMPDKILSAFRSKQSLLVLDNCEHLIEAVARFVEDLLRAAPHLRVLATSQEPLRVEGECVLRLRSLSVPEETAGGREEALRHSSVALFVARAQAANPQFQIDDRNATAIGTICRRLDGIPLAIELAAARTATLGVDQIADGLDHRFELLTGGRRTALPRHQTLQALLDWSFGLLSETEQVTLRRLAVFRGGFTIEAAREVAVDPDGDAHQVDEGIAGLTAKSLLIADIGRLGARYRLLETTRTYVLDKLLESGEADLIRRRHAKYYCTRLETANASWTAAGAEDWLATHTREIDDVRAAINWAFAPGGDAATGCALAAASTPLWARLSLFAECTRIVRRALAERESGGVLAPRWEMHLQAALATAIVPTQDQVAEKIAAAARVLDLAERIGDIEYQLRGLFNLYRAHCWNNPTATFYASRFLSVAEARGTWADTMVGRALVGTCQFRSGQFAQARATCAPVNAADLRPHFDTQVFRFSTNAAVQALGRQTIILWIQGSPDQAMRSAATAIDVAQSSGYLASVCHASIEAGGLFATLISDHGQAEAPLAHALAILEANALSFGRPDCLFLKGYLAWATGHPRTGLSLMRDGLSDIGQIWICHNAPFYLGRFAEALGKEGAIDEGLRTIDMAIRQSDASGDLWCRPELDRIKGELVLAEMGPTHDLAETHFHTALALARRQDALGWELRIAMSLARLWRCRGRPEAGRELLADTYGRYREGLGTTDLVEAARLLEDS